MTAIVYTTDKSTPLTVRNVITVVDVPDEGAFELIHLVNAKPASTLCKNVLNVSLIPEQIHG